jgi:hypothetical protein
MSEYQLDLQECATFPRIFDEGSGTWYTPFYSFALGTVGYMAEQAVADPDNPPALVIRQTSIYFNPSTNETPDDANVFVYIGEAGVPWEDGAAHHYLIWEDA